MERVSGKVAIVTGAARGMGVMHAQRLIEEGALEMLTDLLDAEGEATTKRLGNGACFLHHDVTREADWRAWSTSTRSRISSASNR